MPEFFIRKLSPPHSHTVTHKHRCTFRHTHATTQHHLSSKCCLIEKCDLALLCSVQIPLCLNIREKWDVYVNLQRHWQEMSWFTSHSLLNGALALHSIYPHRRFSTLFFWLAWTWHLNEMFRYSVWYRGLPAWLILFRHINIDYR